MKRIRIRSRKAAAKAKANDQQSVKPLLCDRRHAAQWLDTTVATIRRLEAEGVLQVVRLRNRPTAKVHLRVADIEALAMGGL